MTGLVPVKEFARLLGRSVRSIHDARYRGSDLPNMVLLGGRLYVTQDALDEWVGQRCDEAEAASAERQRAITRPVNHTDQGVASRLRPKGNSLEATERRNFRGPLTWSIAMPTANPKHNSRGSVLR